MPRSSIAHALSLDPGELRALNPHILRGVTPPDRKEYHIMVPETLDIDLAVTALKSEVKSARQVVEVIKHYVKKREFLSTFLKRYDISRSDLALLNGDGQGLRIQRGGLLYIPRFAPIDNEVKVTAVATRGQADSRSDAITGEGRDRARQIPTEDDDADEVVLKKTKKPDKQATGRSARTVPIRHIVKKAEPLKYDKTRSAKPLKPVAKRHNAGKTGQKKINGLKSPGIKKASSVTFTIFECYPYHGQLYCNS
jgi:hypothetical protein